MHPGMKTFQDGKTKLFTLVNCKKDLHFQIGLFLLKFLVQTRKKLSSSLNQPERFLAVGYAEFRWGDANY